MRSDNRQYKQLVPGAQRSGRKSDSIERDESTDFAKRSFSLAYFSGLLLFMKTRYPVHSSSSPNFVLCFAACDENLKVRGTFGGDGVFKLSTKKKKAKYS